LLWSSWGASPQWQHEFDAPIPRARTTMAGRHRSVTAPTYT
jgi:hypothetical protein